MYSAVKTVHETFIVTNDSGLSVEFHIRNGEISPIGGDAKGLFYKDTEEAIKKVLHEEDKC